MGYGVGCYLRIVLTGKRCTVITQCLRECFDMITFEHSYTSCAGMRQRQLRAWQENFCGDDGGWGEGSALLLPGQGWEQEGVGNDRLSMAASTRAMYLLVVVGGGGGGSG